MEYEIELMFLYEVTGNPAFSDCVRDEISDVVAALPVPIEDSEVHYRHDNHGTYNIIVLFISREMQIEDIRDLVLEVPGNLDLVLPCMGEENLTFTLRGLDIEGSYPGAESYNTDLTPSDRNINLTSMGRDPVIPELMVLNAPLD